MAKDNRYKGRKHGRAPAALGLGRLLFSLVRAGLILALFIGVSLGLLAGYRWLTTTDLFALEHIEITGNRHLEDERVCALGEVEPGDNLFALSIGEVERKLRSSPWIEQVLVRRRLPDSLQLQITEKEPAFWIKKGEAIYYAEESGRAIAPVRAEDFVSLPFLGWETSRSLAAGYLEVLSGWFAQRKAPFSLAEVAWIRFDSGDVAEIFLTDRRLRLLLGCERLKDNLHCLTRIWRDLGRRGELKQSSRVCVYNTTGWVKLGETEPL